MEEKNGVKGEDLENPKRVCLDLKEKMDKAMVVWSFLKHTKNSNGKESRGGCVGNWLKEMFACSAVARS